MTYEACAVCHGDKDYRIHLPADECGKHCIDPAEHHPYQPVLVTDEEDEA